MTYPRPLAVQAQIAEGWRRRVESVGLPPKPIMQPLYVDLADDPDTPPQSIHLGLRLGLRALRSYVRSLREIGMHHLALNLRFNQADIETTMKRLADELLPELSD